LETLARVPAAHADVGAGIVAIWKTQGAIAQREWQPRLEEVRRLGHVRVGRNPPLAIDGDECLRGNGDITEAWERHGGLQLRERGYLSCGMTRSLINLRFSSCSA